jgi:tol-pal system protein YbgF
MWRKLIFLGVCLFGLWGNAYAFLEDTEARIAISDLKQKIDTQNQQTLEQFKQLNIAINSLNNALMALDKKLQVQESKLQALEGKVSFQEVHGQTLLELVSQIEKLTGDVGFARGDIEVLQHQLELGVQRENTLYQDTDARIKKIETAAANAVAEAAAKKAAEVKEAAAKAAEKVNQENQEISAFNEAQNMLNESKYKPAFEAFDKFIVTYPTSKYLPEALYLLGVSQFSLKNFKAAMTTQQKLILLYPEHSKVPEAKMMMANCQIQLTDIDSAKRTLRDLIEQHPDSEVIPQAKKRLSVLNSLKK